MFNIIAFGIIIISLASIIIIIYKKMPLLDQIEAEDIQKDKRKKYQILEERFKRRLQTFFDKKPFIRANQSVKKSRKNVKNFYRYVLKKRKEYLNFKKTPSVSEENAVEKQNGDILAFTQQLYKSGKLDEAEEQTIGIIKENPKSLGAYKLLSQIYLEKKNFLHAEATQEHLVKLAHRLKQLKAIDYVDLAHIKLMLERGHDALQEAIKAVRLEPQNPKVLHFLVKLCIACKQKKLAWRYYSSLKKVNKDNQGLDELLDELKKIK